VIQPTILPNKKTQAEVIPQPGFLSFFGSQVVLDEFEQIGGICTDAQKAANYTVQYAQERSRGDQDPA
jgi:hypothetical protein